MTQVPSRPVAYSPQTPIAGPGPSMIPRGPQPQYSPVRHNAPNPSVSGKQRPVGDIRGPPNVTSNKRYILKTRFFIRFFQNNSILSFVVPAILYIPVAVVSAKRRRNWPTKFCPKKYVIWCQNLKHIWTCSLSNGNQIRRL